MLYSTFANGFAGVSIFFTLSGFLITYLILSEVKANSKLDIWAFYLRRTLRIWPLYFAFVIFVFVLFPFIQQLAHIPYNNPADPVWYFTFLSNFDVIRLHQEGYESFLTSGITWSLAIEEQFYIFWPLLFLVIPKRFFGLIFITVIAICLGFRFTHADETVFVYFHTLAVCGDLAIGGLAAFLVLNSPSFRKFFEELPNKWRILIYISGILYMLFKDNYLLHSYSLGYSRMLSTMFFAFVILDQNENKSGRFKLGKIRLLSYWGKYTYGLYLLHPIGLWIITLGVDYFDIVTQSFTGKSIMAFFVLLVTAAIAYLSYHWLEKPFLKIKDRFSYITR